MTSATTACASTLAGAAAVASCASAPAVAGISASAAAPASAVMIFISPLRNIVCRITRLIRLPVSAAKTSRLVPNFGTSATAGGERGGLTIGRGTRPVGMEWNSTSIIIGAGHNGLTCAFYLAAKGLKVAVLEASETVGGAAVTDEFLPGFRNSAASYTVSLLNPKVIRDLDLERHGLKVVLRKRDNFLPGDGDYLLAGRNGLTRKEIVRLNKADGAGYDRYIADLEKVVPLLKKWILRAPPEVGAGAARAAVAADPRQGHGGAVDRGHPHRPRFRDAERGRGPRPLFRGRARQGPVRLRRRGRQFRIALCAGERLRPAPPSVRRGGGSSGRLGPCHRRNGLDHAGDGPRRAREGRRHPSRHAGRGDHRRQGQSGGRRRRRQGLAREDGHRRGQSEAAVRQARAARMRSTPTSTAGCTTGRAKARPSG